MGFYVALESVNNLIAERQWQLHRCHRGGGDIFHYFVTDEGSRVLTPTYNRRRIGLTLNELLKWLEQRDDCDLTTSVRSIRMEMEKAASLRAT